MDADAALDKARPSGHKQRPRARGLAYPERFLHVANHKQAAKRNRQRIKRRQRNLLHLSTMRTYIKRVRSALEADDAEAAQKLLPTALKSIDKAASKGVIHRNTASRYVSRLTVAVNKVG